ncbi:DMT family transporter [Roseovarius sp. SCSIO 43702]|uniref:DMT family transporter n=1 Tax=Roseovarius sp. SCSIO 43702 TaxID=2823043 RepID=UPI001C73A523|nr:DMT family transporter [Roseovarius sp. SCSIO 43702]QYX56134.1 DMT family transporter [Roseovarius sp. SCSIO 43702]
MSYVLLIIVVLSWGLSWFAITLQVSEVGPGVAVAYRFALAGGLLMAGLAATGRLRVIPWRAHGWLLVLGACLFSLNFYAYYIAAHYVASGILSVVFATAAIHNAVNARIFLREPLDLRVIGAAVAGIAGLLLLIWPELQDTALRTRVWIGLGLSLMGTYFFSLGNLVSARMGQAHDRASLVAWGMLHGAAIAGTVALVTGEAFTLPRAPVFWGALIFLAVISSVLAFLSYLALIAREGATRAAYATVLFPLIAMSVSTRFEGYEWGAGALLGLALALGGTAVVFSRPRGERVVDSGADAGKRRASR